LPLQLGVSTGVRNFVRPKRAPPAAAQLLATLRQLRGVQLVFQAPDEAEGMRKTLGGWRITMDYWQ
jgi:hypothetical protein